MVFRLLLNNEKNHPISIELLIFNIDIRSRVCVAPGAEQPRISSAGGPEPNQAPAHSRHSMIAV